jgi:hypothetical protein
MPVPLASEAPVKFSRIPFSLLMVIGRKGDRQIIVLGAFVACCEGSLVDFECTLKSFSLVKRFSVDFGDGIQSGSMF